MISAESGQAMTDGAKDPLADELCLWFCGEDLGIAGDVFDLLHGDDDDFPRGIHLQDFHIIADGMPDGILDQ
jgi:hypothetical protein